MPGPAFGTEGVTIVEVEEGNGDNARHLRVQDDGMLVAAGCTRDVDGVVSLVLIRFGQDGVLDPTFGDGGVVNQVLLAQVTEAYAVAFQGERYVTAGYGTADGETPVDLISGRFGPDGVLDDGYATSARTAWRCPSSAVPMRGFGVAISQEGTYATVAGFRGRPMTTTTTPPRSGASRSRGRAGPRRRGPRPRQRRPGRLWRAP